MDLPLVLRRGKGSPSLRDQIRTQIAGLAGERKLPSGTRLPSVRVLAKQLGVNYLTVFRAYKALIGEGILVSESRGGVFVHPEMHEEPLPDRKARRRPRAELLAGLAERWRQLDPVDFGYPATKVRPKVVFNVWSGDLRLFPLAAWRKLVRRRLRAADRTVLGGQPGRGHPGLVEAVRDEVLPPRGIRAEEDEICLTTGGLHGIFLSLSLVLRPGDRVAIEEPGHPLFPRIVRLAGGIPVPLPMAANGVDLDRLKPLLSDGKLRAILLTPSHQFPTGTTMFLEERKGLLDLCAEKPVWIIEDDYDSGFHYDAAPVTSLSALDKAGQVIHVGSFSKYLSPAITAGFVVAPPRIASWMIDLKTRVASRNPGLTQAVLADFVRDGHWESHLRRLRGIYLSRRDALARTLADRLPRWRFRVPAGGMRLWVELPKGTASRAVTAAAARRGALVASGHANFLSPPAREFLHLGFATLTEDEIRDGVRILAGAARR